MAIQPDPRPAIPADRPAIEEIVRDAYSPYIDRVGRQPGPMLDDYEALIRAGRSMLQSLDSNITSQVYADRLEAFLARVMNA